MSGSINKVIIIGTLGRDPEVRMTRTDTKIVNLSVATSERWRDRESGEQKEATEWHRVVIFDEKIAEVVEKNARKGTTVYLEGQLKTRKWQDQSGQDRYSTEVVLQRYRGVFQFLGDRQSNRSSGDTATAAGMQAASDYASDSGFDDEVPF